MYMYVCIYLRKDKGGSAAGGRAASNMDGTLVLLRRRCRFSFHAMLLPPYKSKILTLDSTRQRLCKNGCLKNNVAWPLRL